MAGSEFGEWWADVLLLRPSGDGRYSGGPARSAFPRLYGGQLVAQCLMAAAGTVPGERRPNSIHTVFLRGGDPAQEVDYTVEDVRESQTLSTRLVRAEQAGRLIASATVSFYHRPPPGPWEFRHDLGAAMAQFGERSAGRGEPAAPDSLPRRDDALAAAFGGAAPDNSGAVWPVDARYVDREPWARDGDRLPRNRVWLRAEGELPDRPAVHEGALAFASDFPMFEPVFFPHQVEWAEMIAGRAIYGASLDHAVWFHRPVDFADWLLLDQLAPVASGSRAFTRAELRDAEHRLVASVAQEVCFVEPRERPAG